MLRNQADQFTAKLKAANERLEQINEIKAEADALKQRNLELIKNSAESRVLADENEFLRLEVQKFKAKSQSLMNEVDFLQQQKSDLILGQENQKWMTESAYLPQIEEQTATIKSLTSKVQQLENRLLDSESKQVDSRRQLDVTINELSNM